MLRCALLCFALLCIGLLRFACGRGKLAHVTVCIALHCIALLSKTEGASVNYYSRSKGIGDQDNFIGKTKPIDSM